MFKDVVRAIDPGVLPFIGLIAFGVAFIAIVVWALTMKKEARDAAKNQPLQDARRAVELPLN